MLVDPKKTVAAVVKEEATQPGQTQPDTGMLCWSWSLGDSDTFGLTVLYLITF